MAHILIIDDDRGFSDMLAEEVSNMGHVATAASTLKEGLRLARSDACDVVLLDVRMPDGNGLEALPDIRQVPSDPEVIIITGLGEPDGAELAISSGAWDYIEKGSSLKAMTLPLLRALQYRQEKLASKPDLTLERQGIIGGSPKMRECLDLLAQAAHSEANALITGESGTGKELFASVIHENSSRAARSFVVVDCAALPEKLVESLLFGHTKGAFTGADQSREGLITQADGGTLFLDEVGELSPPLQKAFLRVLQERRFRPVGAQEEVASDFRLMASTNRDLEKMVERGTFRSDLLFRLRAMTIHLPPLRERGGDIKELTMHYVGRLCARYGIEAKKTSPEFLDALRSYEWPGNVRELVNALERALAGAQHVPTLFSKHLPTEIRIEKARGSVSKASASMREQLDELTSLEDLPRLQDVRDAAIAQVEQQYLERLISLTGRNIREACRVAGLSRSYLYELLKKRNMSRKS